MMWLDKWHDLCHISWCPVCEWWFLLGISACNFYKCGLLYFFCYVIVKISLPVFLNKRFIYNHVRNVDYIFRFILMHINLVYNIHLLFEVQMQPILLVFASTKNCAQVEVDYSVIINSFECLAAQMNTNLCDRFSVSRYPMLLWGPPIKFASGKWDPKQEKNEIHSIDDARTAERLLNWINKKLGRQAIFLTLFKCYINQETMMIVWTRDQQGFTLLRTIHKKHG